MNKPLLNRKTTRRYTLLLFMLSIYQLAAAQFSRSTYDSVSVKVQKAYNTGNPMNMYALTSSSYQQRMSVEKFTEGTNKFAVKVGNWKSLSFKEQNVEGMIYLAEFELQKQLLFLQLDQKGKIDRFNFTSLPFEKGTKQYSVPSNNVLTNHVDSLMEKLVRPYIQQGNTVGLCIAVLEGNKIYKYSYGETAKGNKQLPDPKNTIFEIGSITKTFTSLLLADRVIQKQMNLKDPINNYLPTSIPNLAYSNIDITLEHLSNHTSGLPRLPANIFQGNVDPHDPYRHYTQDSLYLFLTNYKPAVPPGTKFSYSNLGAGLLGKILALDSHKTFEQLLTQNIFKPLEMDETKIELNANDSSRLATGYDEKSNPTALWNLGALQGSGAIRSTLDDMILYTKAQLGHRKTPLKRAIELTHQVTFQSKENIMGLGWRIEKYADNIFFHHAGGTGGFRSFVGFDIKRQIGIVILSNAAEDVNTIGETFLKN